MALNIRPRYHRVAIDYLSMRIWLAPWRRYWVYPLRAHNLTYRLTSPHLLWLKMKRNELEMTPTSKRFILDDVYGRFRQHLLTWFPDDESTHNPAGAADHPAQSVLSLVERRFLKLIDLIELLRLKFEILDVCSMQETQDLLQECFNHAELVANQIDLVAESGVLLYLQDTSATRLSSYGSILHKVSDL